MAIQFVDGKILFVDGAIAFHEDCCCGGEPCTDCAGTQPSATVTLNGGCGGACDAAGVYTYVDFEDLVNICGWKWEKGDWELFAIYDKNSESWELVVADLSNTFQGSLGEPLSCVSGEITGTASAPDVVGSGDCDSCTATAIFG